MSSFTDSPLEYVPNNTISKFGLPQYRLTQGFEYRVGDYDTPIAIFQVPAGFITDFVSIPWPLSIFIKPTSDQWSKAGALHDYLYKQYPNISKVIMDGIFYEACLVLGTPHWLAYTFFTILRLVQPA